MGTTTEAAPEIKLIISDRLKVARELAGLEYDEVETACGVTASYVRRLERGKSSPSVETLEKLCGAYGTTLGAFFASLKTNGRKSA